MELIEDCGKTYKSAPDHIKRAYNQAIFEKIFVGANGGVKPQYAPPFDLLLKARTQNHISNFFGCGLSNAY